MATRALMAGTNRAVATEPALPVRSASERTSSSGRPPCGGVTALSLLGTWALHSDGEVVPATASEQRLVVLLALRRRQRRPYLAGMLWPDVGEKQALTRLRNTLCSLRRRCPRLLDVSEDAVALPSSVMVDVEQLEALARALLSGHLPEGPDPAAALTQLIEADELLLGWYDDWILRERDRINELRIRALEVCVELLVGLGRLGEASEAAIAAITLDPLRESSHRALMRVYLAEGNPALAARQVDRYREILHAELGRLKEPTDQMLDLLERTVEPGRPLNAMAEAALEAAEARRMDR